MEESFLTSSFGSRTKGGGRGEKALRDLSQEVHGLTTKIIEVQKNVQDGKNASSMQTVGNPLDDRPAPPVPKPKKSQAGPLGAQPGILTLEPLEADGEGGMFRCFFCWTPIL